MAGFKSFFTQLLRQINRRLDRLAQNLKFNSEQKTFSMKKKFLALLVIASAVTSAVSAQGFHMGLKAGANLLKIDDISFSEKFQFGYNLGAFTEINFSKKFGIQPELLWSQGNYKTAENIEQIIPGSKADVNVTLNYLQIPLLVSYRPAKFLALQAGPQFGIKINDDKTLLQNGGEAFKNGDLSMLAGAQLNLGPLKAGARYAIGLTDIKDLPNEGQWKSRGWQLYVGLRIF